MPGTADLYHTITPRCPELRGQTAIVTGSSRGIGVRTRTLSTLSSLRGAP